MPLPLLYLDIDGPLIPFGEPPRDAPDPAPVSDWHVGANPLVTRLDPGLGRLLSSLPCELVWATTWMHEANHVVGPLLGLPVLTVVEWRDRPDDPIDAWFGLHWKTRGLVEHAGGRPFIWIDDELGEQDREWVSAHHSGRALLHHVDPRVGLRHSDFAAVIHWLGTATGTR